ncbi:hypothetical protein CEXT_310671 [Caerostris extrusa]|uniref:Uncharacterized protein n=1 Tax=Caerostris extrusa TaxID=172846 RepID=A0AAV4UAC5_CAEEX|nr:hypothetical protein CEXT_310671 [Caerostris extrusa]
MLPCTVKKRWLANLISRFTCKASFPLSNLEYLMHKNDSISLEQSEESRHAAPDHGMNIPNFIFTDWNKGLSPTNRQTDTRHRRFAYVLAKASHLDAFELTEVTQSPE